MSSFRQQNVALGFVYFLTSFSFLIGVLISILSAVAVLLAFFL